MIVKTTPIIPGNENGRIRPEWAGADGVHNRRDPGRPRTIANFGMVGGVPVGDHPSHRGQLAIIDVRKNLLRIRHHVFLPVRPEAHMANGVWPRE